MISATDFNAELLFLATALRQSVEVSSFPTYRELLAGELELGELRQMLRWGIKAGRWRFFPSVPELLEALTEFRGAAPLDAEATAAWERVVAEGREYTPEGGDRWSFRRVLERCGRASAEAFQAAGGDDAMQRGWDTAKRWERFREAYLRAARQEPETRLLPESGRKLLASAVPAQIGSGDAVRALDRIREAMPPEQRATLRLVPSPSTGPLKPLTEEEWERRRVVLAEQAALLHQEQQVVKNA